jgi:hypothetical protein
MMLIYSPLYLMILPVVLLVIGFKFYVLNPSKRTGAGLLNIWVEKETLNDNQILIITKYSIHKWCVLKVKKHVTDMDYFKN